MHHVYSVHSLRELKAVMPESGGSVVLTGHSRPGDGGGGMFQWVATSDATPDDGIVVAADNGPSGQVKSPVGKGRWHRVESTPINARWFGAAGDGADATDAIQRALDASRDGGTVYIPSGIYNVTRPLRIYQGTALTGDGLFTRLHYVGAKETACLQSATPERSCSFHVARVNIEVYSEGAWGVDLRGMSFGRFDHISVHLRKPQTSGYYGPGNGQSPYYNVFTGCHIAGPGTEDTNGCIGFNFSYDIETAHQSANANQVIGGHINSCQKAVICYGTGNVFYGQVFEQCHDGYVFDLSPGRLQDASKGTVNSIAGLYTEYVKRVIVQGHESCVVTAELTHTTGYETVFDGKNKANSVVLTSHDGRLEASRSFVHRMIDLKVDGHQ
mgnify:CR=1 FL=1